MPLRAHMHTHEIFHNHEPYVPNKCPPLNFWMYILDLTSISLKLLYQVSRTLTPLNEENVGNKYPIFWKTPHKHLYLLSDLHAKGVQEWPSF